MVSRSGTPLSISVVAPPGSSSAWIGLVGDVDMTAEPVLAEAIDRLGSLTVRLIDIDIAAVSFAGSTFTHFLDAVHDAHPDAALVLRQPSSMIRRILMLTGQDQFVVTDLEHQTTAGSAITPTAPNMPECLRARWSGSVSGAIYDGRETFTVIRDRLLRRGADASS